MLFLKKSLFLCLFLGCLITLQAVEDKDSLRHFARKVVNGNRTLIAEGHDLTDALISKRKALEVFSPSLTLSADSGNSVNRSYNSATGFDEDYKTENVDFGAEISHRTPWVGLIMAICPEKQIIQHQKQVVLIHCICLGERVCSDAMIKLACWIKNLLIRIMK